VTVYVVLTGDLLGHVGIYAVYADEVDALRVANAGKFRAMVPAEVIPAGMSGAPGRDKA
jgi:hypothetical protein